MFLLAMLSFLQMAVIPGFLVLSYSRITLESKLQALLYTFALSLLINYLLVFSLTTAGIYKPVIIYTILSIEILLVLYYFTKHNQIVLNFKDYLTRFITFWETKPFFYKLLFVLSLVMIGLFFYFFISRVKAVFYLNDPVLAWNRFTLDWFHNQFPVHTWRYPQLIPTNWSIAYMIMQNPDFAVSLLNQVRELGIHISIDDFGTGYSSLAHLKRFSVNTLKIDKSFVRDVESNSTDAAIASAIISMGSSLNLKVIAEGVETEGQLAFLKDRQCDEIQGFLFSRPLPPDEAAEILRKGVCVAYRKVDE